jgi:hypothetical protein
MVHDGRIESEFGSEDYQAFCSCGWAGRPEVSNSAAQRELSQHYDNVEGNE